MASGSLTVVVGGLLFGLGPFGGFFFAGFPVLVRTGSSDGSDMLLAACFWIRKVSISRFQVSEEVYTQRSENQLAKKPVDVLRESVEFLPAAPAQAKVGSRARGRNSLDESGFPGHVTIDLRFLLSYLIFRSHSDLPMRARIESY